MYPYGASPTIIWIFSPTNRFLATTRTDYSITHKRGPGGPVRFSHDSVSSTGSGHLWSQFLGNSRSFQTFGDCWNSVPFYESLSASDCCSVGLDGFRLLPRPVQREMKVFLHKLINLPTDFRCRLGTTPVRGGGPGGRS